MGFLHIVAILIAAAISPISVERANAWAPSKRPVFVLSAPPPLALVEDQWGTPYVKVAGTVDDDGSIIFHLAGTFDNLDSSGSKDEELRGPASTEEPATAPPTDAQTG